MKILREKIFGAIKRANKAKKSRFMTDFGYYLRNQPKLSDTSKKASREIVNNIPAEVLSKMTEVPGKDVVNGRVLNKAEETLLSGGSRRLARKISREDLAGQDTLSNLEKIKKENNND